MFWIPRRLEFWSSSSSIANRQRWTCINPNRRRSQVWNGTRFRKMNISKAAAAVVDNLASHRIARLGRLLGPQEPLCTIALQCLFCWLLGRFLLLPPQSLFWSRTKEWSSTTSFSERLFCLFHQIGPFRHYRYWRTHSSGAVLLHLVKSRWGLLSLPLRKHRNQA